MQYSNKNPSNKIKTITMFSFNYFARFCNRIYSISYWKRLSIGLMEHRQCTCKCKRTHTKRFVGNRKKVSENMVVADNAIGVHQTIWHWTVPHVFHLVLLLVDTCKRFHFNGFACSKCRSSCPNFSIFSYRQCNNHGMGNLLIVYFCTCSGQRIGGILNR